MDCLGAPSLFLVTGGRLESSARGKKKKHTKKKPSSGGMFPRDFSGTISIRPLNLPANLSMRPWNPIEISLPLRRGVAQKHGRRCARANTQSARRRLTVPFPFLWKKKKTPKNGNLGEAGPRRSAWRNTLTASSLREKKKMFLICSCHLIIRVLPRLRGTILQDINSQLNPGLYHLWGQSSRSPRRCPRLPPREQPKVI